MKFLLYDFRWIDEKTQSFQASLGEKFGVKKVSIGDELSLEIMDNIRCAGSRVEGVWQPCPEKNTGKPKCELCRARERKDSFVFTVFDGFNTENLGPDDLEKIAGEHQVYLALFTKDLIKVGVCKKERETLRQVEQGSFATLFIATTPDGTLARQIETSIRKSGIQDKVLSSQKTDTHDPGLSPEEAKKVLLQRYDEVKETISQSKSLSKHLLKKPLFQCWDDVYHLGTLQNISKNIHPVKLQPSEWVSGKLVAVKGSFLFVETPDEIISLNAKDLSGYDIEFDPKPHGLSLQSALQSALF